MTEPRGDKGLLRCGSVVPCGRWAGTRCERFRWHFSPHWVGFDVHGLSWTDEREGSDA